MFQGPLVLLAFLLLAFAGIPGNPPSYPYLEAYPNRSFSYLSADRPWPGWVLQLSFSFFEAFQNAFQEAGLLACLMEGLLEGSPKLN